MTIGMLYLTGQTHVEAFLEPILSVDFDGDITLEEDVAVILVALGVYLEERGLFTKRLFGEHIPHHEEEMDEISEVFGAYMLMIGLIMETNDQCFEPLLVTAGLEPFGIGVMIVLDAAALIACLIYPIKMFQVAKRSTA